MFIFWGVSKNVTRIMIYPQEIRQFDTSYIQLPARAAHFKKKQILSMPPLFEQT